ncbi:MAG: sulfatase-like hydrolase/transferase, partial [Prolixibacteraceae bacterium]
MKNKTYFFVLILSILISACNSAEKKEERPNVLLFFIDDYGYGDISFEGNTQIKTPNIDRIAENGIRFDRFYQSSGACAPTRASLLTGRYYLETGVWGVHRGRDFLKRDEVTIANVLQDNGYATGAFGKWHSGKTLPYFSWNRGFDVGVHPVLYQHFNTRMLYNNKLVNVEGPVTTRMTDQVIRFIENNRDEITALQIFYDQPHGRRHLTLDQIRELARAIEQPPLKTTPEEL